MSLPFGPEPLPSIQYPDEEETKLFRRIHTYKKLPPIEDFGKALQTIQSNPNDFRANQFLGWHYLEKNDEEAAISYLKKAAKLGTLSYFIHPGLSINHFIELTLMQIFRMTASPVTCLGVPTCKWRIAILTLHF
jgi:hypothetical protein